jgi:hypothetical protein
MSQILKMLTLNFFTFLYKKEFMPRKPNRVSKNQVHQLLKEIEKVFGRSVAQSADCNALSDMINKRINQQINPQTIRRIFNLIPSISNPSLYTLNTFSFFCGYDDWKHFLQRKSQTSNNNHSDRDVVLTTQAEIIESFFDSKNEIWLDNNYFTAVRKIAQRIYENPLLAALLWERLARKATAQTWLFERSPYIDGLATEYSAGIQSYLRHKQSQEAKVFGNCLLFLGAYLNEDSAGIEKHFTTIKMLLFDDTIYCLPLARQIGTYILYYHLHNEAALKQEWVQLAMDKYLEEYAWQQKSSIVFPGYHYIMAEYLLLAECYEEALTILNANIAIKNLIPEDHHSYDHIGTLRLKYAIANAFTGNEDIAKKELDGVKPEDFCYLFRDYFAIQYLLLKLHLTGRNAARKKNIIKGEIEKLIKITGFTYFNKQLQYYF